MRLLFPISQLSIEGPASHKTLHQAMQERQRQRTQDAFLGDVKNGRYDSNTPKPKGHHNQKSRHNGSPGGLLLPTGHCMKTLGPGTIDLSFKGISLCGDEKARFEVRPTCGQHSQLEKEERAYNMASHLHHLA